MYLVLDFNFTKDTEFKILVDDDIEHLVSVQSSDGAGKFYSKYGILLGLENKFLSFSTNNGPIEIEKKSTKIIKFEGLDEIKVLPIIREII